MKALAVIPIMASLKKDTKAKKDSNDLNHVDSKQPKTIMFTNL